MITTIRFKTVIDPGRVRPRPSHRLQATRGMPRESRRWRLRRLYLTAEFKVFVFAEEIFEVSQPGRPHVRRDQDAELDKLRRRSNHWVS